MTIKSELPQAHLISEVEPFSRLWLWDMGPMITRVSCELPLDKVVRILVTVLIQHEEGGNVPEPKVVTVDEA